MSKIKLHIIGAACENMGIGVNGTLPWRLKKEMAYFTAMTSKVLDPGKRNAVIMGRKSWDSIPDKYRPLPGRVNIVLTQSVDELKKRVPEGVIVVGGMDEAVKYIQDNPDIESAWVIGGSSVYKAAMDHDNCGKIYLTEIRKHFDCDTFFPKIDLQKFQRITEENIPTDEQIENGISYYYTVYEKVV